MRYPGSTSFQLGVDLMNRPRFFHLIAFSGSAGYNFQTSPYSHHALTVLGIPKTHAQISILCMDWFMSAPPASPFQVPRHGLLEK